MKKIVAVVLVVVMCCCFVGCGLNPKGFTGSWNYEYSNDSLQLKTELGVYKEGTVSKTDVQQPQTVTDTDAKMKSEMELKYTTDSKTVIEWDGSVTYVPQKKK